ncbi:hypothetical protein EDB80DRAFT_685921 [Ilyonectria destructans]|nr:hypothetical protein EDB80DRAFT_685921 [Ilyonectria destructans]
MDPLSVTGAIVGLLQLTQACLRLGKRHLGPSQHTTANLTALLQELYCFNDAMTILHAHLLETYEKDEARLNTFAFLESSLKNCNDALFLLEKQLASTTFMDRKVVGKSFDRKLNKSLDVLKSGRAEDIREMQSSFDTVGGYVLDLSRQFEQHTKQAERRHMETHSTIPTLNENVPKLRDGTNLGEQIRRRVEWAYWIIITLQSVMQLVITKMLLIFNSVYSN